MRNFFNPAVSRFSAFFLLAVIVAALTGCSGGGGTSTTGGTTVSTAHSLSLAASATSVKSDNSSSVTITATVLDASNAELPGQTVQLQATTGQLSTASAVTDANGSITATFSSGALVDTNRTATITATISGSAVTESIPIVINGSTLSLSTTTTSVTAGIPIALTATVKNAGGTAISGQTVHFAIVGSGSGSLSTPVDVTTDINGMGSVNFTGSGTGTVNVLAEWLDGTNVSASATETYTVAPSADSVFEITTPTTSPFAVTLGVNQGITVNVPTTIGGTAVSQVRFATTLGTWLSNSANVKTVSFSTAGSYTQTLVTGAYAGNANVQIDALASDGTVITSANLVLSLSASAASAASITLSPQPASIAPSSGGNTSTATLTAMVYDSGNNPVSDASVLFSLLNPHGGGEQISPVVVMTDDGTNGPAGQAKSTFTAGTGSTTQLSQIQASVVGASGVQATTNVTVGGTATSVAIGTSTSITAVDSDTSFQLPVTVLVSDSSGAAISGAVVSISIWPEYYYKGTRNRPACTVTYAGGAFNNEDVNENNILDPGEDIDGPGGLAAGSPYYGPPDGQLWPPSSAAGSLPSTTVTTGTDGTATFNWTYLNQYVNWVGVRLRATTSVLGTETTTETVITLAPSAADAAVTPCALPDSPFN